MRSSLASRRIRLALTFAILLAAFVGVTAALVGFTAPSYAGSNVPSAILKALLQQSPTPIPTPVAAACAVRFGDTLVIATDTATIELNNDGAAATVQAATLAWPESNGDLTEIQLGNRVIWSGTQSSPAATVFPNLTEVLPNIKAGEQTSLTLRFSTGAVDGQYILILHLGNECYAVFDSNRSTAQSEPCFATFDDFRVDEQEAALNVQNSTTQPLAFGRVLVFWPWNQSVIDSIRLGEYAITGPFDNAPVDAVLDPPITLQPGQSIPFRLLFEGNAPLVDYTLVLETSGCRSVFSNAQPPSECPVRQEGGFVAAGQTVNLLLQNLGSNSEAIQRIWIDFPVEQNSALKDVTLDNVPIVDHSGDHFPKTSSPATMTAGVELRADASLAPNSQSVLSFEFEHDASPEDYAVQIDFPDECRLLATTPADEPPPCQMQVDPDLPVQTEGNQVWLNIQNVGGIGAELNSITVDWDDRINGSLTEVALGDTLYWYGRRTGGTATVTYNGDDMFPVVEAGQSVSVRLTFERPVAGYPYSFRLDFVEGCTLLYETQPGLGVTTPVEFGGIVNRLPEDISDGVWEVKLSATETALVEVTPHTLIDLQPAGLIPREGDIVFVRALPIGDQEYLASYLRVTPYLVKWTELTGVIEVVDPDPPIEYIVVQGVWVFITSETDVEDQELQPGWQADIQGFERADGSLLAHVIRTTPPQSGVRRVAFQGFVNGWTDDDPSLSEGETLWDVSGLDVIVHRDHTIHHGILPGQEPVLETEVQVAGDLVSARRVRALELWYGSGTDDTVEFEGSIRELPDSGPPQFLGVWLVENTAVGMCDPDVDRTAEACVEMLVTQSTFLDTSEASVTVGAPVQVRARRNPDNNLEVLWLKIFAPD